MKQFYEEGQEAVTAEQWIRYFKDVAEKGSSAGLMLLSKVCEKWLRKHAIPTKKREPEYLPEDLNRGSSDFGPRGSSDFGPEIDV